VNLNINGEIIAHVRAAEGGEGFDFKIQESLRGFASLGDYEWASLSIELLSEAHDLVRQS
jgi:hypothetical protein